MGNVQDFLLVATEIVRGVGLLLFLWGIVDNYFLTRYGGRINRGFTIWSQPLKENEKQFLMSLAEEIVDKRQVGFLKRQTKTDFISIRNDEALIRYNTPGQRTSWPLVGYVDLSTPNPRLEYRLSLPMLLGTIFIMFTHIIIVVVLSIAFVFSWLFETGGLKNYLSQKADLYYVRQVSQSRTEFS